MASTITQLINNNFGGIRKKDAYYAEEKITCSDCQNVELFYTGLNSGVGLRTAYGNKAVTTYKVESEVHSLIPSSEEVIEIFETVQDTNNYLIVYTESETKGRLYNIDLPTKTATLLVDNLTVTGKACGTDFSQGWLDMFIFSNGEDIKYIYTDTETHNALQVETSENLHLTDQDGRTVKGLGLVNFDSRLWVFDGRVLWYSEQGECRNFLYNDSSVITSAGFIEFVKNITAIFPYLGSLAVFHKDSSVLVVEDETTVFAKTDESPGGCANYRSLVFHGTDLYFYDDTKKGVFSFKQIINGDKTLGENIALDIQEELMKIQSSRLNVIKALSVVNKDRNEVWFLIPTSSNSDKTVIMIFDYLRGEWVKRVCQHINTINTINGTLYSAGKEIYQEYVGNTFNGEFIESFYTCSMFNFGAENTMKITKFPPRLTLDGNDVNDFYVKYVKNYNYFKKPKIKHIKSKTNGLILTYDTEETYDSKYVYIPDKMNVIVKMPSTTFKALEITFYTEEEGQSFTIKSIEYSKLKVKQV